MTTRTANKTTKPAGSTRKPSPAPKATPRRAAQARAPAAPKPLSPEQLATIMRLGKNANSVELKLSIPLSSQRAALEGIGLDPVEAQPRQAYFFDTPDLALNRAGVVVRARRIQGGRADTVIKIRPVDPTSLDPDLRRSAAFKVEIDLMPGGFVCSGSFKGVCTGQEVLDVSAGTLPLSKIFSKEQRAFFREHAPEGVTLDQLVILGPTFLLKAKHHSKAFGRPITVELWLYPDGARILEVSTKCLPEEAFQVVGEFKAYLSERGIVVGAKQQTKTKASFEFFGAKLRQARGSA